MREIMVKKLALGVVLALLAAPAGAALEEMKTFSTDRLTVRNLIGEIQVEGHRGANFEVQVRISGSERNRCPWRLSCSRPESSRPRIGTRRSLKS